RGVGGDLDVPEPGSRAEIPPRRDDPRRGQAGRLPHRIALLLRSGHEGGLEYAAWKSLSSGAGFDRATAAMSTAANASTRSASAGSTSSAISAARSSPMARSTRS